MAQISLVCLALALLCAGVYSGQIVSDLWIQIPTPDNPPLARYSHSAIFNPLKMCLVVFGGEDANGVAFNDISTYTVDEALWVTNVPTDGISPSPRYGHSAVVTGLNTMVIFGGRNGTTLYNDVFVFDLMVDQWIPKNVLGTPPSPRAFHTAVVDRYQHVMYVYGGTDGEDTYSDIFMLDLDAYAWTQVTPVGLDSVPRAMHSSVMTLQGEMISFGGVGLSDVKCFDVRNHSWWDCLSEAAPAPGVTYGHTAVVSPLQRMVVYGGRNSAGNAISDIWNFDMVNYKWESVTPGGSPINPRVFHTSAPTTFGTMIAFGGIDGDGVINNDFGLYTLANMTIRSANDGAVLVVIITLLGTILLALCFAMDYMKEQNEIEKGEALAKARSEQLKNEQLLLPKLPAIPKALQIPLGPRAQKFFDEFKMSLDPMQEPPK